MPHSATINLCDLSHLSGVHNRAINHDNNHLLISGDIMRKTLFGLVAVASATGTAHAEGLRAELHGGFDGLDRRNSSSSEDGFGGIGVGYDFSINDKTFIGVEANLDESGANIRGNGGALAIETSVKANLDINVNTRIGTTLGDGKTKVYALAGYANLRIKAGLLSRIPAMPMATALVLAFSAILASAPMPRLNIAIPIMKAASPAIRAWLGLASVSNRYH
jgi:hypothetical protein